MTAKLPSSFWCIVPSWIIWLIRSSAVTAFAYVACIYWTFDSRTSYYWTFASICCCLSWAFIFSSAIYCLVLRRLLPDWSNLADDPLLAMVEENIIDSFKEVLLTAHGCWLLEYGSHLWVHLDSKILLDHDLCVSSFDLLLDPARKAILENCCTHVSQPLLRHFWQLKARLW